MRVCGVVLAAGAGTRYGSPKGLARTPGGEPWVARAVATLRAGGCDEVVVVVGARGDEVAALVPAGVAVVTAGDWVDGLAASLRTGLAAAAATGCDAVAILPVDVPDASPAAIARVLAAVADEPRARLAQAVYGGVAGHPVVIGAGHLDAVARSVTGDRGARAYLATHDAVEVECADLWSGADVDRP